MADIEKIAADRYRVRSHDHLVTLNAQDLLDMYEYVLQNANTLTREAIASKDELHTDTDEETVRRETQSDEAKLKGQPAKLARPPYYVGSHIDARQWRKWTYDATDEQLLAALRGAGDSFESVPAQECSDELKNRGYTLVGAYPHEVTLEKPEGQSVDWSEVFDEEE